MYYKVQIVCCQSRMRPQHSRGITEALLVSRKNNRLTLLACPGQRYRNLLYDYSVLMRETVKGSKKEQERIRPSRCVPAALQRPITTCSSTCSGNPTWKLQTVETWELFGDTV